MNEHSPKYRLLPRPKVASSLLRPMRLGTVALLSTFVAASSVIGAEKKSQNQVPAPQKSLKSAPHSTNSTPVSLGNGIYILGDGAAPTRQPSIRKKATRKPTTSNINGRLVQFCRSYLGRKLGNGQCSELAMLGIPAVGGQLDMNRQWGNLVCFYGAANGRQWIQLGESGVNHKNPRKADVRPGDIIQYENIRFEKRWEGGYSFQTYPHHTSVIEQVSKDGRTYKVLEQNVDNTQFVRETTIHLPDLTQGTLHITRPIPRTLSY